MKQENKRCSYLLICFVHQNVIIYTVHVVISDSFNSRYHLSLTKQYCLEFLQLFEDDTTNLCLFF
jgi:hypothetical protein